MRSAAICYVLPVNEKLSAVTLRNHLFEVQELGEERPCLIDGCEPDWEPLPIPDGPLTVVLDGGFVRARHKRGCFEGIAGKSVLEIPTRRLPSREIQEVLWFRAEL